MTQPYWQSSDRRLVIYHGRAEDVLPEIRADVVLTDPPYGISGPTGPINRARAKGAYTEAFEDNEAYIRTVVVPIVCDLIERVPCVVLTPGNRHFALYPQPSSFGAFYQPAAVGLQTFGNVDAQPIYYYGKNASGRNMGVPCSYLLTENAGIVGHPCAKPRRVWTRLLGNISRPELLVLDPFLGSGTTMVAAQALGRRAIGIEIEERYAEIAAKRLEDPPLLAAVKAEQADLFAGAVS